jgi:hypothetical protein
MDHKILLQNISFFSSSIGVVFTNDVSNVFSASFKNFYERGLARIRLFEEIYCTVSSGVSFEKSNGSMEILKTIKHLNIVAKKINELIDDQKNLSFEEFYQKFTPLGLLFYYIAKTPDKLESAANIIRANVPAVEVDDLNLRNLFNTLILERED